MRSSTRVILLACLLLAPTALLPVASAEWSRAHGWGWKDARETLAWALDEEERFHFASKHEREFLLYEEGPANNLSTWFVRPFEGIERVTVAEIGGEWGVLWLEHVGRDRYGAGERSAFHFAWPVTDTDVAVTRLGGGFPPWHAHHVDPVTGALHFLRVDGGTATRYSLFPDAWNLTSGEAERVPGVDVAWSMNSTRLLTSEGRMRLVPDGSVIGVEWSTDGVRAVTWNGTGDSPERLTLDPYWDYQDARLSHSGNGSVAALVSYRRDACDLFQKAPDANWTRSRVEPCPLTDPDVGVDAFRVHPDGRLVALTKRGYWSPGDRDPTRLPCNDAPHGWTWRADGREFILGPGPTVWERVPAPNVTASVDPSVDVPTGFAVKLRLDGNLSALTDPVVKWSLPGASVTGANASHVFLAPGNFTVRASVESGVEECRSVAVTATVPVHVTGPDRTPPEPTADDAADAAAAGNETGGNLVPAPALPGVLVAALAGLALARRSRA